MSAVSNVLLQTIKELQSLQSLSQFALAGGTNLAFRFNHRESQDIDLFCPEIVGVKHLEAIEKEIINFYGKSNITGIAYPADKINDQYSFFRCYISKPCGTHIKVEIIQNMKMIDPFEIIDSVRLVTIKDLGLFKLISGSSRAAKKDIYDLDFITEKIPIIALFEALKTKKNIFSREEHKNIFDLDEDKCPTQYPLELLNFDRNTKKSTAVKPNHSNDKISITENGKTWQMASSHWRMKLRKLYNYLDIDYPKY